MSIDVSVLSVRLCNFASYDPRAFFKKKLKCTIAINDWQYESSQTFALINTVAYWYRLLKLFATDVPPSESLFSPAFSASFDVKLFHWRCFHKKLFDLSDAHNFPSWNNEGAKIKVTPPLLSFDGGIGQQTITAQTYPSQLIWIYGISKWEFWASEPHTVVKRLMFPSLQIL